MAGGLGALALVQINRSRVSGLGTSPYATPASATITRLARILLWNRGNAGDFENRLLGPANLTALGSDSSKLLSGLRTASA